MHFFPAALVCLLSVVRVCRREGGGRRFFFFFFQVMAATSYTSYLTFHFSRHALSSYEDNKGMNGRGMVRQRCAVPVSSTENYFERSEGGKSVGFLTLEQLFPLALIRLPYQTAGLPPSPRFSFRYTVFSTSRSPFFFA
uniref:Secreted protein n=1 Tax=Trypanosoma congolense (strain IL3000) TaxID=1068625 RepID=G0UL53_TRYCI|nr:hypothetical protein, unlikely [Trypanosoma congolense IL3000]